ncbi:MAG TPA: DPP IV N-terminal domain-containing protein [Gemmatimonadaceae bacterium]|nr:DPP IV N-terminal domain-containing protein [Gemmatimonadaceae bacterium]
MRATSLLVAAALLGAAFAGCTRERPGDASVLTAPTERAALGVGPHGGGPPGSVVFYSRRGGAAKIYRMNADGSDVTRLTDGPGDDLWPDISPNGRQVVFASNRSGNNEIYVLDLADGTLTNVSNSTADDSWPRWSPNGQDIVFHSNRAGNYDIYVVNGDGSDLHAITTNSALDQWPDWSPDGQQIVFRRGNDVYVADADGVEKNVQRLTFFPTAINQMATWSPDGRRIAFMSLREGYCAVFLMNADGSNPVNLTPKDAAPASSWCSRAPSWSRNGRIYFMSFRTTTNGDVEIFSMADDGSDLTRLTNSAGEDGGPRAR